MLTIFSIPKPFRSNIDIIQRNAIQSWTLLRPACEIILLGDDEGTAEVARQIGIRHIPDIARNEFGTPLLNSIFESAERVADHDLLCYVNADIILMSDFMEAVHQVAGRKRQFLMVGQRWDVDMNDLWDFVQPDWEQRLLIYVKEHGKLHPPAGIDYFVFSRGLWQGLPPFAIGRTAWDNWLIYRARSLHVPVVNATDYIRAVHQNHAYINFPNGAEGVWKGPEAKRNMEMAGGYSHIFTLEDTTHVLTPSGLKLDLSLHQIWRRFNTFPILFPQLRPLAKLVSILIRVSRPLRSMLGLIMNPRRSDRHEA